jgi:hypothetical protein
MRNRVLVVLGSTALACGSGATALATSAVNHYTGGAGAADSYHMSFSVVHHEVVHFTFVSRCAGTAHGITVPAKIPIHKGKFAYHDKQFTITGRFLPHGMARGTERDRTGDCDSGLLDWSARK